MTTLLRLFVTFLFLFQMALQAEVAPAAPSKEIEAVQTDKSKPTFELKEERPEPPTFEGAFLKMILVLVLLLFVIFFIIWVVRRLTHARLGLFKDTKHITIIDRRPLSTKTALYLIEIGDRRVLVAESQLEVNSLTTIITTSAQER